MAGNTGFRHHRPSSQIVAVFSSSIEAGGGGRREVGLAIPIYLASESLARDVDVSRGFPANLSEARKTASFYPRPDKLRGPDIFFLFQTNFLAINFSIFRSEVTPIYNNCDVHGRQKGKIH